MVTRMQYLILGVDSYIGGYLYDYLKKNTRIPIIGTTRRVNREPDLRMYDIERDDIRKVIRDMNGADKVAVICIAISNINQCHEEYECAYHINVTKTKELTDILSQEGFRVIFFSSDNVYDGKQGNYREEEPTNAINCYGKMKAEVEDYILKNIETGCILRISKVVCAEQKKQNVFYEWETKYQKQETINCIRNNRLSFVAMEDVCHACLLAGEKKLSGLYNVVGDIAYSRKELAELFFEMKGITDSDICECDVSQFHFKDERPLDISMDNRKFRDVTNYDFTSMKQMIRQYISDNKSVG